jgi:hypothetical protein
MVRDGKGRALEERDFEMRRLSDTERAALQKREAAKRRRKRKLAGLPNLGFAKPSWVRLYRAV